MMSASKMSEAIRMKRKKLKDDGLENMVDTAPGPQMNAQDVWNEEKKSQREELVSGAGDEPSGPGSATMEGEQKDNSQSEEVLEKRMARVRMLFDSL